MYHQPTRSASSGLRVKLTGIEPGSYQNESDLPGIYQNDIATGSGPSHELCMIDAGIRSLLDVPLFGDAIQTLNLHCNQIAEIENLEVMKGIKGHEVCEVLLEARKFIQ